MAKTIVIRSRANLDLVELAEYIGANSIISADRFMDACEATFKRLAESPYIGSSHPTKNSRLELLYVSRVMGFPNHLAFYLAHPSGIEIVRVLHGSRDLDAALAES